MSELGLTSWEPGIYRGIPFELYKKIPAINQSVLKLFARSPAHARHYQLYGREETDSLEIGTLIHAALLEWERFVRDYGVMPDFTVYDVDGVTPKPCRNKDRSVSSSPRSTTDYKDRVSKWELENLPKYKGGICTAEQMEIVKGISAEVARHSTATRLLTSPGDNELTIVWQDPETSLLCKARIDRLAMFEEDEGGPSYLTVVDVKSLADARPHWFSREIHTYGYHLQAPFYGWGLATLGKPPAIFAYVAVETSKPHGVMAAKIGTKSLDEGWRQIRKYLCDYKECLDRDYWPSYPDRLEEIEIPKYGMTAIGME